MPSSLLILTASDVTATLASIPASHLLAHSAHLFHTLTHTPPPPSYTPHRTALPTPHHTALIMPARVPDVGTALKVVAVPSANADAATRRAGLPASTLVLDERTGVPRAFVNARLLTAARTAAGTILATTLIRPPGVDSAGLERAVVFGAGAQARAHAFLLADVYAETLRALTFVVRRRAADDGGEKIDALVDTLVNAVRTRFPRLVFTLVTSLGEEGGEEVARLVEQADIIVTATPATAPLFDGTRVKRGAHLILVGSWRPDMHEIDGALVRRAGKSGIVVDSRAACAKEAGEFIDAGVDFSENGGVVEFGDLVARVDVDKGEVQLDGAVCARVRAAGEVTIVKSVGVGAQDVAIADVVVHAAEAAGLGTRVAAYDVGTDEE